MTELERALLQLGRELDLPAEPDLRSRVRERIERRPRYRRALVPALALLLVALGIALAVPDARSAILRFFHIGSATIERVETLPPARERPLTAGLGPALSLREAEIPLTLSSFTASAIFSSTRSRACWKGISLMMIRERPLPCSSTWVLARSMIVLRPV